MNNRHMNKSVSAIVCAYNEDKTIKPILEVLVNHSKVDEVIAIDDGSKDKTWKRISSIKSLKMVLIRHLTNLGKGASMAEAVEKAKGKIILFVDADLINLRPEHINVLLDPLALDETAMTIGIRTKGTVFEKNLNILLRAFGGERAIRKKYLLPLISRLFKSGYGAEAIINLAQIHAGRNIYYFPLVNLVHKIKYQKHPIYEVAGEFIRENTEVLKQYLDPENRVIETFRKRLMKKLKINKGLHE